MILIVKILTYNDWILFSYNFCLLGLVLWIETEQPFALLFKLENKELVLELVAVCVPFCGIHGDGKAHHSCFLKSGWGL